MSSKLVIGFLGLLRRYIGVIRPRYDQTALAMAGNAQKGTGLQQARNSIFEAHPVDTARPTLYIPTQSLNYCQNTESVPCHSTYFYELITKLTFSLRPLSFNVLMGFDGLALPSLVRWGLPVFI